MTDTPQPENENNKKGRWPALRAQFNTAARRVFNKRTLKMAAPLLMTTALVSDSLYDATPEIPVWGHSVAAQSNAGWPARTAPEGISNIVRCYEPRTQETSYSFNADQRSWHGFYTLADEGGATSRLLHAAALRDRINACVTTNAADNARYARTTRQIGINQSTNEEEQLRAAAHGLAHSLMLRTGEAEGSADEQLTSRLSRRLMAEALAITVEYMIAAELHVRGDATVWNMLVREGHPGFKAFQDALARNRFAFDGRPMPLGTLQAAATETANSLMRQPDFIAFHADDIMRDALAEITLGRVQRPSASAAFNDADARELSTWHVDGQPSVNFSSQIRLVTHQELVSIARDTAARIEGLEHIKARKFSYRGPQRYIANNPYDSLKASDLAQWLERTQGRYTVTQAMTRIMNGNTTWGNRAAVFNSALQYGIQADYRVNQAPSQSNALWRSLQLMREHSPMVGTPLINHASQNDVFMCYSETMHNAAGVWVPSFGTLFLNPAQRGEAFGSLPTFAHEMMHAVQSRHTDHISNANYSIYDLQAKSLASEAAARTVSSLTTIEMYANGGIDRSRANVDGRIFDVMVETYDANAAGDRRAALEAAGLAGYRQMYTVQWWLNAYNSRMIRTFVNRLGEANLQRPQPDALDIDTLRLMGRVSDNLNFTRDLRHLPSDIERFGNNDQMRQMFAWLHYQHLAKTFGVESEQASAERNLLVRDRNPYLRLDLDAFRREISNIGDANYFLRIANRMVGIGPGFIIPPAGMQHSKLVCT